MPVGIRSEHRSPSRRNRGRHGPEYAIVEVLRTALAYFSEGRVKVTYIIDTVIVTILTEEMAFWYKEME
jgi:hypothetical protein